ncbi:MAG: YicC family protein [Rhodobacteraceae bacterium]|nr:YicC family protein [Paracoccaceae bacterium]
MVNSMTAFASCTGELDGTRWALEIRSVNGRGLDVRPRLPEGCEALEAVVKAEIAKHCKRGNVNVTLRLKREFTGGMATLNPDALAVAVQATQQAAAAAEAVGLPVAPMQAADLLAVRGVFDVSAEREASALTCLPEIKEDIITTAAEFAGARAAEGQALWKILTEQIDQIADMHATALTLLPARQEKMNAVLRTNVAKVMGNSEGVDADRLAQELALLVVKSDVAEELDRLGAHIVAARELLAEDGAIGRKFDFLTQEFNREANTLCSKANFKELTRIGLDLKTVIDQMREQVQNVE